MRIYEKEKRQSVIIKLLILLVLVLIIFMAYVFLIQPGIQGYVVGKQIDAQAIVIASIIQSLNQNGFVQITDGNGTTITLVPYQEPAGQEVQQQ